MAPRVIRAASMASSHSNGTAVKSPPPTRGMWANGSRLSSICGNPANEPSRYSAMNPTSTPHATGVNRGANPNNPTVAASADHGESFVDVTDLEVLSFLSVSSVDYWAYRPALQQVAAWYWTLKHPEQSGSVGERAARAVAEVASEGYGRALEFIAYRYALATGIIDETGFPEAVAAHWLTTEERHGLGNDPISISARVITRTLFVVRLLPAIDHFLDLLRKDSRLPRWRAMAAHALCKRDDLARQKPHLNLGRPDPTQLKRLFGARWGTQVNRIELARRGLMTEDAFYAAATPFAVAAVDDQLPRIEVGTLGPAPLSADVPERHFDFGSV